MIKAVQQFMLGTVTGREKQARQTLESHRNWVDGSPVKSFQRSAQYLNRHF